MSGEVEADLNHEGAFAAATDWRETLRQLRSVCQRVLRLDRILLTGGPSFIVSDGAIAYWAVNYQEMLNALTDTGFKLVQAWTHGAVALPTEGLHGRFTLLCRGPKQRDPASPETAGVKPGLAGLPFTCPANARIGGISLAALIDAAAHGDDTTLTALRGKAGTSDADFDLFARSVQDLAAQDYAAAIAGCARITAPPWRTATTILQALAMAASGDLRAGLAFANPLADAMTDIAVPVEKYLAENAFVTAGLRCLATMEQTAPRPTIPPQSPTPFSYLVSYPRSGNTMVRLFLSHAFAAPLYSVYPGDGRYFSRSFHDNADGHAVFVRTHDWEEAYAGGNTLAIIRDGRDAMLSFARFLHADGFHQLVGPGQLADFLSFAAERGFGFWADHVRKILAAKARGARIRLVRYEDLFRNHAALMMVARELAQGVATPRDDEAGFAAHWIAVKPRLQYGGWNNDITLPEGSYLPPDWSIGGGKLNWRQAFDAAARHRFHELGGTEMLLALGYEADSDWWRG